MHHKMDKKIEKKKVPRRKFFKKAAVGGIGLAMGTALADRILDLWAAKAEHGGATLALPEMLTLAAIAAQIIPTGDAPGAQEAGIVDYIDTKIKDLASERQAYQKGLQEVENVSKKKFGVSFAVLHPEQKQGVLKSLGKTDFFARVWKDTVEGFCRSRLGQ